MPSRLDGRAANALRPISLTTPYYPHAEGSCWFRQGKTEVLVAVSIEQGVPRFLRHSGRGWLTAEYSMLPRSGSQRSDRRATMEGGRTKEIARLIGRSLRTAFPLDAIGECSIRVDCDVISADGGTRTASITAASIALEPVLQRLAPKAPMPKVVAISVGVLNGEIVLDPDYAEDSQLAVDANFVFTEHGELIDVGFLVEAAPCPPALLGDMLAMAQSAIPALCAIQRNTL